MARGGSLDLAREVPLARTATSHYLRDVLNGMAARSREGNLAFGVFLSGPGSAQISVPVELALEPAGDTRDGDLHITVRAHGNQPLYPTLDGRVATEELESAKTRVHLSGTYDVPLGLLGSGLNALVMHSRAEESVARWLDDVVAEIGEVAHRYAAEERNRIT